MAGLLSSTFVKAIHFPSGETPIPSVGLHWLPLKISRFSPVAVETVEVLRGGASSLYGDAGLSGAVNLLPRKAEGKYTAAFDLFGGSQKTMSGSGFAGFDLHGWQLDAVAHSFQTKGYIPVGEQYRGPVDSFAGVSHP